MRGPRQIAHRGFARVSERQIAPIWGYLFFFGLLALIFCATFAQAAGQEQSSDPDRLSPSFDSCYEPFVEKSGYVDGLMAEGWNETADRSVALARLTDAFLPLNGPQTGTWRELLDYRATRATEEMATLTKNRAILEQDGATLLLAGYADPSGNLWVECSIALADSRLTNDFFDAEGGVRIEEGRRILAYLDEERDNGTTASIYIVQLTPFVEPNPPLAAKNGVLTRLVIPAPSN